MEGFNTLVSRLRMRHFDFLDRLGRDPNLARVAQDMNMAHSTATKMLQDIEQILGAVLFTRNRRGIKPTLAGDAMIRRAGLLLSDLRAGHDEFEVVHKGGIGQLRLGVFPVATTDLLPDLYGQLHAALPGLNLLVEEGDEIRLAERLSSGKIDLVLGRIDPLRLTPDLRHRTLFHEETAVVCGAQNPIAHCAPDRLAAIMAEACWILPTRTTGASRLVSTWLVNRGYGPPRITVESISPLATMGLLSKTELLGILPISIAQSFHRLDQLRILPVHLPQIDFPVGLIYRAELEDTLLVRMLLEHCTAFATRRATNQAE
jgi:DNA-binding transcriptional LysR family regulator